MNDIIFFFSGWQPLARILVVGTIMYGTLVLLLRLSGSRTLASMNAFDFIVTVAIGSVFGRALTAKGVALAEAAVAFILLIGLQYIVAWLQTRVTFVKGVITNPPVLLYFRREYLREAMQRQRVTDDELRGAARKQQYGSLDDVEAIVLESDGKLSIIGSIGNGSALEEEIHRQIDSHD